MSGSGSPDCAVGVNCTSPERNREPAFDLSLAGEGDLLEDAFAVLRGVVAVRQARRQSRIRLTELRARRRPN